MARAPSASRVDPSAPTSILRWEEPPGKIYGGGKVPWEQAVLAELRARPQKWALLRLTATTAHGSRMAVLARRRNRGFEFTVRRQKDGRCAVYGRFVG